MSGSQKKFVLNFFPALQHTTWTTLVRLFLWAPYTDYMNFLFTDLLTFQQHHEGTVTLLDYCTLQRRQQQLSICQRISK